MFYPQEMTEVEMVVPSKDLVPVTKTLAGQGVFHQVDASYLSSGSQSLQNVWQERAAVFSGLERRVQILLQTLSLETGRPSTNDREPVLETESYVKAVDEMDVEVKKTTDQLSGQEKHLEQLEAILRQLDPVATLDLDISALRNPRYLFSILGTIPQENVERLNTSLSRIPHVFFNLEHDSKHAVVWLGGTRNNADILDRAARSAYLNPLVLPDAYQGTPARIIASVQKDIETTKSGINALKADLAKLGQAKSKEVVQLLWDLRACRILTDAIVRFGKLNYTYVVGGWVPSQNLAALTQRVKSVSKDTLVESFPTKRASNDVPVAMSSSRFLSPFQMLVNTYSRPLYGEIDPTILIAITFPLLYGAMFGDFGQGIVLAVLGWLIASKRILRSMTSLGGLIMACGASAAVFGLLYGSFFGSEEIIHPLWLQPSQNIMTVLLITIGAGVILLNIGFVLSIINAWKLKDWGHVLFDHNGLAGMVLYWGMIGMLAGAYTGKQFVPAPILIVMMIVGGIVVMFAEVFKHLVEGHRPLIEGGIGTYGIQAFFELFEALIGFLSNTLSYVRVGAFAVAHGALSLVIFQLAGNPSSVGYWIVVLIGNIFIIGFEGLIVGIQTMRLEYYEFFGKFFKGGGLRFDPIKLQSSPEE